MAKVVSTLVSIGLLIGVERAAEFLKQSRTETSPTQSRLIDWHETATAAAADDNSTNIVLAISNADRPTNFN